MVRIYSFPECPYCTQLKEILTNEGIKFIDVNVNLKENEEEFNMIQEKTKAEHVPIVLVKKHLLIPNVSFQSIPEAGELVKKLINE